MKKLTVGIDVSKDKLDFCTLDQDHRVIKRGIIENKPKAIAKWVNQLDLRCTEVAMEHTGYYGALLAWLLSESNVRFYMINPFELKSSLGIQRERLMRWMLTA